jgi:hypothetical protein
MAVRRATRRYDDLASLLAELDGTLKSGAILLPPDIVEGELAPEIKLDIVAPVLGRVGPITAQVVHRSPAGTAMQLPRLDAEAGKAFGAFWETIEAVEVWLRSSGRVGDAPGDSAPVDTAAEDELAVAEPREDDDRVAALEARIAELEAALAAAGVSPAAELPPPDGDDAAAAGPQPDAAPQAKVRGFPVPDLRGVEPTRGGALDDGSMMTCWMQLAVEGATGIVTVKLDDGRTRYGFWSRGGPVGWRTDPVQEKEVLGVLLYKAGQLTKEQLADSVERMERDGLRQGEALMEMGLVGFSQLTMILGKQCEFVLLRALAERGGSWTFHALDDLPERFLPSPLRIPSLLFRQEIQRSKQMPSTELADYMRPRIDEYVHFRPAYQPLLREVKLTASESKLLETMQSDTWRTREVLTVSPLSKQNTVGVLRALIEVGFLHFEESEDHERFLRRVRDMVEEKRKHLMKATHYDVLEVHWISIPREIEEGYRRLMVKFDPATYPGITDDLKQGLLVVRGRLKESFEHLRDDARRREHRKEFIEPMMIQQSAELLAKQGEMGIMRKDRRHASLCFAKALELAPGRPDFREGMQRALSVV